MIANPQSKSNAYDVEVFFDGDCPLCKKEINFLKRRDKSDRILATDISSPEFVPAEFGKNYETLMAEIHGRLPDGTWITGVEVFRRLYAAIGLGPLVMLTRLPGIRHVLDFGYRIFAKNRLKLTGRCDDGVCQVTPR
ncbi:MAG: DUF393 domain-containing protein [Planctomycetota bacterium]